MSHVTNLILSFSIGEDESSRVSEMNLFENNGKGFELATADFEREQNPGSRKIWYGGSKFLETPLYVGAYNHLDIEGLIEQTNTGQDTISDRTESKIEINLPVELNEQQIYRCGWCGNLVGSEGDQLTEYMWNYTRELHQIFGESIVQKKNGYCCRKEWSYSR